MTDQGANVQTPHALAGTAKMSDEEPVTGDDGGDRPIVMELMEGNEDAATAKIDAIADSANDTDNRQAGE